MFSNVCSMAKTNERIFAILKVVTLSRVTCMIARVDRRKRVQVLQDVGPSGDDLTDKLQGQVATYLNSSYRERGDACSRTLRQN